MACSRSVQWLDVQRVAHFDHFSHDDRHPAIVEGNEEEEEILSEPESSVSTAHSSSEDIKRIPARLPSESMVDRLDRVLMSLQLHYIDLMALTQGRAQTPVKLLI